MPAKLVEVNIEHGDKRVKIPAQSFSVGRDKIFTGGKVVFYLFIKYSLQGTTQGRYLTGGVPPVRFSM